MTYFSGAQQEGESLSNFNEIVRIEKGKIRPGHTQVIGCEKIRDDTVRTNVIEYGMIMDDTDDMGHRTIIQGNAGLDGTHSDDGPGKY